MKQQKPLSKISHQGVVEKKASDIIILTLENQTG